MDEESLEPEIELNILFDVLIDLERELAAGEVSLPEALAARYSILRIQEYIKRSYPSFLMS